ncbi:unnamed protein product [Rotaria magnacalcarata]|uniref:Cytochrome c oxidase assembly protein COX19 n=1 Tax=Rotaria magnacalcarata TaxID=392030 RepID=A0A815TGS6_9BILA|nr:unnamed protein product [Rotaria magnacalcarata]CAF1612713.1 unnamed protein product [Rotaria magnacalcarata]CAF2035595.1 unnamed protein product [Rotaria magnacalcarata]CAF2139847.1 unnamed protein product [Rotaria magnacalcarata]CAF2225032.1 unnamed protein product [Rotaria magnacalcarata]
MTSYTLGQKHVSPVKPERGVFPLDHEGECKEKMLKYMLCLTRNDSKPSKCQTESKEYFQCRMDRNLMKKHEWEDLGYFDGREQQTPDSN